MCSDGVVCAVVIAVRAVARWREMGEIGGGWLTLVDLGGDT